MDRGQETAALTNPACRHYCCPAKPALHQHTLLLLVLLLVMGGLCSVLLLLGVMIAGEE
jgi:hypothetical protein